MSTKTTRRGATTKGFARTSSLLKGRIRDASASRGFEQSRLLTHWEEVAGPDAAAISRPVEVSYARGGFGATLVLLTTGAQAPMLEMRKEQLRERVNQVYGYNAIARIRITQTAPTGFAEGQAEFKPARNTHADKTPSADVTAAAARDVADVGDDGLRSALTRLGAHIKSKTTAS